MHCSTNPSLTRSASPRPLCPLPCRAFSLDSLPPPHTGETLAPHGRCAHLHGASSLGSPVQTNGKTHSLGPPPPPHSTVSVSSAVLHTDNKVDRSRHHQAHKEDRPVSVSVSVAVCTGRARARPPHTVQHRLGVVGHAPLLPCSPRPKCPSRLSILFSIVTAPLSLSLPSPHLVRMHAYHT